MRRIIGSQGRSRAFINDNPVTVKSLEELGSWLIHVYGQNESQQLLSKEHYVSMVDRFLHLEGERQALSERVRRLDEVSRLLEAKKSAAAGQGKEIDLLTYQLQEIERERIGTGEEERVRERLKVLKDAARIKSSIEGVVRGLYEDEQSAHSLRHRVLGAPQAVFRYRVGRCDQEEDGRHLFRGGRYSPVDQGRGEVARL